MPLHFLLFALKLPITIRYSCDCLMKFRVVSVLAACLLPLITLADSPVVFNEIMYHPLTNESQLEWVELQSQMGVDMDISDWRLDGGIRFSFPAGTVIRSGGYLL